LTPAVQESWAIIDRQVTHLVRLVDDLLDVSRISQGKIRLMSSRQDLAGIVTRAVEGSQPLLQARRHAFTLTVPSDPLPVDGDSVRLVQVLSNLLNNAAKYTPEGGQVSLTAERQGAFAVIRVRDNGPGIPIEMLPRLFDLFTQSDRTLDRAEGGLGIGLTLVKRLTEMHGGSVEAFSEGPGKGSEFVVKLPLADAPATPAPATPAFANPAVAPRRVLVVDDSRDSANSLARLLTVLGHDVAIAYDGPEALVKASEKIPEVILLDIGLPGMNGYEVARQLRADKSFAETIVVALTGYGSAGDRVQSQGAGFNAHLVKPVDLDALQQLLAKPAAPLLSGQAGG